MGLGTKVFTGLALFRTNTRDIDVQHVIRHFLWDDFVLAHPDIVLYQSPELTYTVDLRRRFSLQAPSRAAALALGNHHDGHGCNRLRVLLAG